MHRLGENGEFDDDGSVRCKNEDNFPCSDTSGRAKRYIANPPDRDPGEIKYVIAPDGGWGWVVCFACFMTHVLTDGMFYSFGVVYVELLDYYHGTKGETAWIASLAPGILQIIGPIVGALINRFGCRLTTIIGAFITSGSFIISIFAPNLYFLYFSLGAMKGIGYGLVYLPSIVCVSQYFEKHRALATGLGVCGSGIGTFIFSPLTKYLIDTYTWKGAILIQGVLVLNCIACGAVYRPLADNNQQLSGGGIRSKVKKSTISSIGRVNKGMELEENVSPISRSIMSMPSNMTNHQDTHVKDAPLRISKSLPLMAENTVNRLYPTVSRARFIVRQESLLADGQDKHPAVLNEIWISIKQSFALYRNTPFCMFVVSIVFYSLGYYVPYIYLPDKAKDAESTTYRAAFLVATVGIRTLSDGWYSDASRTGKCVNRMYLYSTALVICGIGTSLAVTFETMLLYSVVFGLFSGVTISLTSVIITDLVGIDRLADAFGLSSMFGGIAAFIGPPIAGWLFDATGSYDVSFVVSGVAIAISGVMLYFLPCIEVRKKGPMCVMFGGATLRKLHSDTRII